MKAMRTQISAPLIIVAAIVGLGLKPGLSPASERAEWLDKMRPIIPKRYLCRHTDKPIVINTVRFSRELPGLVGDLAVWFAKDNPGYRESVPADCDSGAGNTGRGGKPAAILANAAHNARFRGDLASAHDDLIQNAATVVIQPQCQLPLPISDRNQFSFAFQVNRPLPGGQDGKTTDQQQKKSDNQIELTPWLPFRTTKVFLSTGKRTADQNEFQGEYLLVSMRGGS